MTWQRIPTKRSPSPVARQEDEARGVEEIVSEEGDKEDREEVNRSICDGESRTS